MASPTPEELSETFELLQSAHRRFVLHYLRHEGGTADVRDVASALSAWEPLDRTIAGATVADLETMLTHVHLPKLADARVVAVDSENGAVTIADTTTVDPYLSLTEPVDFPADVAADDD
jgi:hypothetical protein